MGWSGVDEQAGEQPGRIVMATAERDRRHAGEVPEVASQVGWSV